MCDLCSFERKTKWYYEDDEFIICDCKSCGILMIVSKEHANDLTDFTKAYVQGLVQGIFKKKFHFREKQGKIQDHWHKHIFLEE